MTDMETGELPWEDRGGATANTRWPLEAGKLIHMRGTRKGRLTSQNDGRRMFSCGRHQRANLEKAEPQKPRDKIILEPSCS